MRAGTAPGLGGEGITACLPCPLRSLVTTAYGLSHRPSNTPRDSPFSG